VIGAALGMSRQAAREYYSRATRARLEEIAAAPTELSDDDAMALVVEGVKTAQPGAPSRVTISAVLDSDVFVSAAIEQGPSRRIVQAWLEALE